MIPLKILRITPRDSDFLEGRTGARGEIYYDEGTHALRLYDGVLEGGRSLMRADLSNSEVPVVKFFSGDTAPLSPAVGDLWFNTNNGSLYIRWNDGNSTQWIQPQSPTVSAGGGGGSGGVQSGSAGRIAYYPATGTEVNDLNQLSWNSGTDTLSLTGQITVSGQKNYIRFHWDTLADLNSQAPAATWHGMVAHVHDTGRLYYAHAGSWIPVALESELPDLGSIEFAATAISTADSSAIEFTGPVIFDSDITVGNDIIFPDGTRLFSATGVQGPPGPQGPSGATGAGTGDVVSAGGSYVDNSLVRYDGTTGTIIQTSTATLTDGGLLTATNFSGGGAAITALNAANLGSGTIPDARFPATLPAVSGANLTALPATLPAASGVNLTALNATQLTSGTVPVLRLGASGTRDATTYLRGDNTWAAVSVGASALDDLTDVIISAPSLNQVLKYNGTNWVNDTDATGAGVASNSFETIAVAGQSSVVADSGTDTLTLVAGTNITITTNASTDTITINASGGSSNSFETIAVAGQSSVVADSGTDTLTLSAGTGITITTNASTDTITITNSVSAFTGLTDVVNTTMTIDQAYLPAITRLTVSNNASSSYSFDQYGALTNPTVYAISGTTIAFNLTAIAGHPFLIQTSGGSNYNTGLVHVSTNGTVQTGSLAQGQTSGTLYWKIPYNTTGSYRYQCSIHGGMQGTISIKDIATI